jgi:hypothetical protein
MDLHLVAFDDEVVIVGIVAGEAEMPDVEVPRLGNVERRQDRDAASVVAHYASKPVREIGWATGG